MKYWYIVLSLSFILFSCLDEDTSEKENKLKARVANDSTQVGGRKIINAGSVSQYTGKPGRLIVVAENTEYTNEIEYISKAPERNGPKTTMKSFQKNLNLKLKN